MRAPYSCESGFRQTAGNATLSKHDFLTPSNKTAAARRQTAVFPDFELETACDCCHGMSRGQHGERDPCDFTRLGCSSQAAASADGKVQIRE